MNRDWSKITEERDCLSESEIKAYCSGILPHDQKASIERHLIDCQFCSDAIEGYQNNSASIQSSKKNYKYLILPIAASLFGILVYFSLSSEKSDIQKDLIAESKESTSKSSPNKPSFEQNKNTTDRNNYNSSVLEKDSNHSTVNNISENKALENSTASVNSNKPNNIQTKETIEIPTPKEETVVKEFSDEETNLNIEERLESNHSESIISEPEDDLINQLDNSLDDTPEDDFENRAQEIVEFSPKNEGINASNEKVKTLNLSETKSSEQEIAYKKQLLSKSLGTGARRKVRKPLKEEEIDYNSLNQDYSMINESDFMFDSLSPNERDSIGLILDQKRYEYEFTVAKELYEQKNYVKALKHLEKVLNSYGGNSLAIYLTANSYQETEQYDNAIKLYKALFETSDINLREKSKYNCAFCYWKTDNKKKAIKLLDEMISGQSTVKEKAQSLKKMINNDKS